MKIVYRNIYSRFTIALSVCLILFLCTCKKNAPKEILVQNKTNRTIDSLDISLSAFAKTKHLPGFVVATFTMDGILFSKGYGYADIAEKKPYNTKTVQMIASVSKVFASVALMKLVEQGKINLDDPINKYLPFDVVNPHFPSDDITIRHLATHTASLNDDPNGGKGNIFSKKLDITNWRPVWHTIIKKYNENQDMPIADFLENIYSNTGTMYSKDTFLKKRPGTYYEYSNFGVGLLAYIIESVSKQDYRDYTKKQIFEPLQMNSTGWSKKEVDTLNHITYYNDNYKPCPDYKIITYPDGGLYTNVEDMIKFMQEMMKGYTKESDFLEQSSFKEMMTPQLNLDDTKTGLLWDLDNDCCIGHGGNDFGIATMVYFDKRDLTGKIVLSNIDVQQSHQEETFYSIFDELFNY